MALVEVKDLTYYYPETDKPALDKINLSINEGEFVLIVGGSGSGKSSLVRALAGLIPDFYGGKYGGSVSIAGVELRQMGRESLVQKVGMVFQDPESQLVMTNVEQELAFGLENLGLPKSLMKRRIMEVAEALSLTPLLKSNTPELSGGLKQKVALASILAMQPDILILDEPTSQLDPVAGEEILTIIRRLNEDNGITVILIEQRLERCFHLADRFLVMEQGQIVYNHTDRGEIAKWAVENKSPFIPPLAKLFTVAGFSEIPLTVKEGRKLLKAVSSVSNQEFKKEESNPRTVSSGKKEPLVEIEKMWFAYENGTEALQNINFKIYPGDLIVLMGENAAGKTTLLKNIRGLLKPTRGKIKILHQDIRETSVEQLAGIVGYLSQNPNDYLFLPTVREELAFTLQNLCLKDNGKIDKWLERLDLTRYAMSNPRDLSSGERQRVALASVLVAEPQLILLDEPTRGLDYELKNNLGQLLLELQKEGKALLVVTHDVEFAAEFAQEVVLMTQGTIIARGSKYEMLTQSTFYSPQVSKLFNKFDDTVVTLREGEQALKRLIIAARNLY
ncbi:MAG: ABC transporter ATP-binding protein [Bacillota bacterium]|uniref:ATP-binding cassette domain-containing protein n=1 Tax=Thermanaerosceptrum fracticalcis TaxID=1712410 RepID=A0A7G6E166_THEFR|nr:ABC transporter ATP-binding protein [Thermanaerosceptrum fracticalcis]QNB45820.1 ATP-binding cassette domain-containing protein [Thermanaerosceptrum fracticalcis]